MSIPDTNNMKHDCPDKQDCFKLLQSILDGEATQKQKESFMKDHLEHCMPCYKSYHLEVAIRELLKQKCCSEAPQDLVKSIQEKVLANLT